MTSRAVVMVPRRAAQRISAPVVGAHRLRHAAATEMLAGGASLSEIAQVLRHGSESTTRIYAAVDRAALFAGCAPVAGGGPMSALHQHLDDYLAIRRALGYQLRQEARMLASFVEHLEAEGLARVTVDAALAWATVPEGASPTWWAKRLTVVRGFATYLVSLDVSSEVPPHRLLANRPSRTTPYLYSEGEILALMDAARRLADPMRAATFEAFIGLMAATGMRTGEAMRLDRDDVNLGDAVITVQSSKNGKSRLVLLHETTSCALDHYAAPT